MRVLACALLPALFQREAKDKARIHELSSRIQTLEEDRKWFDKEVCVRRVECVLLL